MIRWFGFILCLGLFFVLFMYMPLLRTLLPESAWIKMIGTKNTIECSEITYPDAGRVNISLQAPAASMMQKIAESLAPGGEYHPPHCKTPQNVAIIVPYKNRVDQLPVFLAHIHPFLQRQNTHYKIYVVDQPDSKQEFNRGMVINIGFKEALRDFDWTCFILHDVDHLPEDDRNLYSCSDQPRLMAVAVDKRNYNPLGEGYFGGIVAVRREHFEKINGFSNRFWGWGGEDDDLGKRIVQNGMNITRCDADIARYTTFKHGQAKPNPDRMKILKTSSESFRFISDGLSNLSYTLLARESGPLFTNITVKLDYAV